MPIGMLFENYQFFIECVSEFIDVNELCDTVFFFT